MSLVASHPGLSRSVTRRGPLAPGFGLFAAAIVSLGLWGGLFWLASLAF
jgi:hypothetical protein